MSPDHLTSPQSIGQLLGCSLDGLELKICIYSFFFQSKKLGFSVSGSPPSSPPEPAFGERHQIPAARLPTRPLLANCDLPRGRGGWGRLGGGGRLGLGAAVAGRYWPSPPLVSGRLR